MRIQQFEQSGSIFHSESGVNLAIDIGSYTPVESLHGIDGTVDHFLVSHIHPDHFSHDQIEKLAPLNLWLNNECSSQWNSLTSNIQVRHYAAGETVLSPSIKFTAFPVDHGPNAPAGLKENYGFLLEIDGQKIYFAGDMYFPPNEGVENLEVDYALLPIGGYYTLGPQEAVNFTKQFKHIGKIIPMHYEYNKPALAEFNSLINLN